MSEPNGYNLGNDFDLFRLIRDQLKIRIPQQELLIEDLKRQLHEAEVDLQNLLTLDKTSPAGK